MHIVNDMSKRHDKKSAMYCVVYMANGTDSNYDPDRTSIRSASVGQTHVLKYKGVQNMYTSNQSSMFCFTLIVWKFQWLR